MNNTPRKNFVLKIANTSNAFETLYEKICVIVNITIANINKIKNEKSPIAAVIIANQKVNPVVTANDLNRGEETFIPKLDK